MPYVTSFCCFLTFTYSCKVHCRWHGYTRKNNVQTGQTPWPFCSCFLNLSNFIHILLGSQSCLNQRQCLEWWLLRSTLDCFNNCSRIFHRFTHKDILIAFTMFAHRFFWKCLTSVTVGLPQMVCASFVCILYIPVFVLTYYCRRNFASSTLTKCHVLVRHMCHCTHAYFVTSHVC